MCGGVRGHIMNEGHSMRILKNSCAKGILVPGGGLSIGRMHGMGLHQHCMSCILSACVSVSGACQCL